LLRPALDYIDANLAAKMSIKHLAALCHVSESYFSKLFNREIGLSVPQYITMQKVATAKKWLSGTEKSVTQISNELGFTDSGYFIKIFKNTVGITPYSFKKLNINING
jgi:AraC-like DNA-binding protein